MQINLDIVSAGYQFDYVFDWTILKYPQIGGSSSRGRVSTFVSCLFGFCFLVEVTYYNIIVLITAWKWQGSYACRTICTKARKSIRSTMFIVFIAHVNNGQTIVLFPNLFCIILGHSIAYFSWERDSRKILWCCWSFLPEEPNKS